MFEAASAAAGKEHVAAAAVRADGTNTGNAGTRSAGTETSAAVAHANTIMSIVPGPTCGDRKLTFSTAGMDGAVMEWELAS